MARRNCVPAGCNMTSTIDRSLSHLSVVLGHRKKSGDLGSIGPRHDRNVYV